MQIAGTKGRIEIELPLNPPAISRRESLIGDLRRPAGRHRRRDRSRPSINLRFKATSFRKRSARMREVPVPLEDSVKNMAVIEAVFRSAESGKWEQPGLAAISNRSVARELLS